MAIETFKCDPSSTVGEQSMTIVPSGTAVAALTKATVFPETTATEPRLTSATNTQKGVYVFAAPAALKTAIEAGGKVIGCTLRSRVENRVAAAKNFKLAFIEPAFGTSPNEPELAKTTGTWVSLAMSKAEAEANLTTVAKIQALRALIEHLTIKELWIFQFYLEIELEPAAGGAKPLAMMV